MPQADKHLSYDGAMRAIPMLAVKGADKAIEQYKKAFGATENYPPAKGPDGKVIHSSLLFGNTEFFVTEENPAQGSVSGKNVAFYFYVPDADAAMKKAVGAGFKETKKAEDTFWGDRMGMVTDPFGVNWSLATHVRDVSKEEMDAAMKKMGAS